MAQPRDEFDGFDYSELTVEDWDTIQAIEQSASEAKPNPFSVVVQPPSQPSQQLENIPGSTGNLVPVAQDTRQTMSPAIFRRHQVNLITAYRKRGSLSVSDIVAPSWCEVKFDYGLRWGNRWQRVAEKPKEIITAKGKRIEVSKVSAQKSETVMDAGKVS